jgi:hypothetical protein
MRCHQAFDQPLLPIWRTQAVGSGQLEWSGQTLRLVNGATQTSRYTNAQIDDYQGLARRDFHWRPPLRLTIRARFSHSVAQLQGTGGFGFWNEPFGFTQQHWPTLPRAIWFFFSSTASNMKLAEQTPGFGWKAATIDAWRLRFFLLLPTAPVGMLLMRNRTLYRWLWPFAQAAIHVSEALAPVTLTDWHTYTIEWGKRTARLLVDQEPILVCATPPRGPLGLVIWLDNQAMIVTPWSLPRHHLVSASHRQWLELAWLTITA